MGGNHSARKNSYDANGEVDFDHFQILRAIGKGSFGKVCIVQKKDTKKMFAMKYMNKSACIKKDAISNVMREIEILQRLEHPFLVNLWFAFQDEEDMFMVVDLLLGGDLRYHITQEVKFNEKQVLLYICEIGLSLDYLEQENILHRDIKPDNILLDEEGHVHLTDFNIATVLKAGQLATSMSGTKPYMAPEVFECAMDECPGYSYPIDWWSTGIVAYEMLRGKRPYEIHSNTSIGDVRTLYNVSNVYYPSAWGEQMRNLIKALLSVKPESRLKSLSELKVHSLVKDMDFEKMLRLEYKPGFIPPKDHLNCDPTFELEEMIIEAKPLHKKKKRLAKKSSKKAHQNGESEPVDPMQVTLDSLRDEFKVYNRDKVKELTNDKESQNKAQGNSAEAVAAPDASPAIQAISDRHLASPTNRQIPVPLPQSTPQRDPPQDPPQDLPQDPPQPNVQSTEKDGLPPVNNVEAMKQKKEKDTLDNSTDKADGVASSSQTSIPNTVEVAAAAH